MRILKRAAIGVAALGLSAGVAFAQSGSSSGSSPGSESTMGGSSSDSKEGSSKKTGAYGSDNPSGSSGSSMGKVDKSARDFFKKAHESNTKEVEISRLAETKAQSPEVKDLARQMVRAHEQLGTKMQSTASDLGVAMPQSASSDKEQQKFQKASGKEFDKQYVKWLVDEHKKDISSFEKEADKADANPTIRGFAIDALPKLRHHLMMAQQIQQTLEGKSGSTGGYGSESGGSSSGSKDGSKSGGSSSGASESSKDSSHGSSGSDAGGTTGGYGGSSSHDSGSGGSGGGSSGSDDSDGGSSGGGR